MDEWSTIVSQKVHIHSALIAFLHDTDVLVIALTLIFTEVFAIFWKVVQMGLKKFYFH